ncbi:AAA family ATPase [Lichenifustis flavocetrariae]|uniref:AAA family ATPase n=1 Tax=Lichenifustis flavocetrariae TaxID=2949735 RepID=A0AA42CM76_9HYPH|nr:AAA family ATPase [Lichenifustis flavocetrariae]MCW6512273.1 AAA family ATPase [Lichenifustis flavocetrariae]
MIPALTELGRSFKGAAAYYFSDKVATLDSPGTVDRVAWTATFNLPTDDPDRAWRMMAHTALAQRTLKTVAGVKATGRKLEKPVLAYSLSWHPDERPTKADQLAAAQESLLALCLDGHQAIVICHTDEPHPHVHVLVNRVHPMTGKAAPLAKSKLALSQWAQAYEERHGRVFCRARVENNARRAGVSPGRAADNRTPRAHRREHEASGSKRHAAALRRHHAELFSAQAGQEQQAWQQRTDEVRAFRAGQRAIRKAAADRLHHQAELAGHPGQADEAARVAALLAGDRPADALHVLTRDRSTFTRAELVRFVGRHTPDAAGFATAMAKLDAAPELVRTGRDTRGRDRFTTQAHQALERRMADSADALARAAQAKGDVAARFKGRSLCADQLEALHHVLTGNRLACVAGIAGSGKSTMLDAARQSWEAAGFRVQGMALAAEAAHGLQTGAGIKTAGTIHSRLYLWEQGRCLPGPNDVIVVDEAGMVGSRQMERLLHFARKAGAKVVLVGDAQQLQAIEAGGAFRAIADRVGDVTLRTVRRQKVDWQRDATADLAAGRTAAALDRYEAAGMVHSHATGEDARAALIAAWNAERRAHPDRSQIVMAFLRRDVAALNALARACMRQDGALGADVTLTTAGGPQAFAQGDRLAFLRNDTKLGVRNGSLGTIEAMHGRTLTVRLDGQSGNSVTFSLDAYGHVAHGYAATIHKSQGATVDRAHLYCSPNLDRHAAYVAMTRHRDRLDLHWSRDSIPDRTRLAAILSRANLKDTSLDYAEDREREHAARHEAAEAMRDRVHRRAAAFAAREKTREGRMANARSILPSSASPFQVARLALDALGRARLFRHRQSILRQWARRILPAPLPAAPAIDRLTPAARRAAIAAHDAETLRLLSEMDARHADQRAACHTGRATLQRQAAANWRCLTSRGSTTASFNVAGTTAEPRQAGHPVSVNDNVADRAPPSGPRPL